MERTERLYKIDRILHQRGVASFSLLQAELEVSRATLKRDLAYLRDRFNAPIVHDRDVGGYRLALRDTTTEAPYALPGLWFSSAEILALLSTQRFLESIESGGLLAEQLAPIRQRLTKLLESRDGSTNTLARRIRIVGMATRPCAPRHFQTVATAVIARRRLFIRYGARGTGLESQREISPQRLVHYRDNWYLDAWCHLRDELRRFAVDAMHGARLLDIPAMELSDDDLDAVLAAGYGIFSGTATHWATLHFTPERARWIAVERWHPQQKGEFLADGRYRLRVPYSQDTELIMDILKYGPDCEVVAPTELRGKVIELLKTTVQQYGNE